MRCSSCGGGCFRAECLPYFSEDRLRMRKTPGAPGENWSWSLGAPMPESRAQRRRIEKEQGIEFVAPHEMPGSWRNYLDYRRHVDSGGERLDPQAFADKPKPSRLRERIKHWMEHEDGAQKSRSPDYTRGFAQHSKELEKLQ